MSVSNGQIANATTFNNAFVSRTAAQTSTAAKLDLLNTVGASGPNVVNLQREVNSLNSITGRTAGSVFNATLAWVSSFLGSATDTLFARAEALTLKFKGTTVGGGHGHSGTDGDGAPIDLASAVSGALPIANGGTGQTTAAAAFNALDQLDFPRWKKVATVGYATFAAVASTTNDLEVYSAPAKTMVHAARLKHSVAFAGTGITGMGASVGITGLLDKFCTLFDIFQSVGATVRQTQEGLDDTDEASATSIRLAVTSVGANLDQLTAGSVDVWLLVSVLP